MDYFNSMGVYEYATIGECYKMTGKQPIGTRWIDVNKGDSQRPNYRSRLVAKEYKVDVRPDLFAATPPTECLRLLLSKASENKDSKVLYVDVSRAYFYAKSVRPTFIKLPAEDPRSNEEGLVGKLMMSMYGTRDAAQNWAEEYSSTLQKAGYKRGKANPCLFHSEMDDCGVMVHGDDFVAVGSKAATKRIQKTLEDAYKVKCETLGGEKDDLSEIRELDRVIRREAQGYTLEADPRHAELVIRDLGLTDAKPSKLPGSKEEHKRAGGGPHGAGVYPLLSVSGTAADSRIGIGKGKGEAVHKATDSVPSATKGEIGPLADASPQRGGVPGGVLGGQEGVAAFESTTIASLGDGDPLAGLPGVVGGCAPRPGERGQQLEEDRGGQCRSPPPIDEDLLAKDEEEEIDEELLDKEEAKLFRGIAARLNYMGPDRPDMQYAIKEAARCMANPRRCDWGLLKKLGRYLLFRPRLILRYDWQKRQSSIDGYTDSDWGGCTKSRRSTSGAVMMVGRHVIKSYSKQQKVLALSSAEAETNGMVACSAELLGIQACAKDMGMILEGVVYADASAALGIVQRRGVGNVRHIRTQALWLQEAHATKVWATKRLTGHATRQT